MEIESKLIPVIREAIDIVKLLFFKKLQESLPARFDKENTQINLLAGAIINELFGTPNNNEPMASFTKEHRDIIEQELLNLPKEMPEMCIPLTDALRIAILCDYQSGADNSSLLARAQERGILITDRDMPMPNKFMELVRILGSKMGVLITPQPESDQK
ncbi:MAG: hypothetical protein KKE17_02435 [Proteobacteria bacterium]|nr:hypothetical protein [Pseudomonadota bacterium]MBU1708839.1 hypothetical protein [Pseudomonadota bacterium]